MGQIAPSVANAQTRNILTRLMMARGILAETPARASRESTRTQGEIKMSVYQNLMSKIEDAGLLFNVIDQRVYLQDGTEVPNKRALINSNNGKIMSLVSDGYKVVTNEEIFSGFCKSIEASGLDITDAQVKVKQTETGARNIVDFVFPAETIQVRGDDSATALQICALNSFDGTTRYVTKAGGLRIKCLNGQVLGDIVGSYSSTHTAGLNVDVGAQRVIEMIQQFNRASDYWSGMMQSNVSMELAEKVILEFLGIKHFDKEKRNARYETMMTLWKQYRMEMGQNVYALYNAMTHYISHPAKNYARPTEQTIGQRERLAKLQKLPVFKQALNIAA